MHYTPIYLCLGCITYDIILIQKLYNKSNITNQEGELMYRLNYEVEVSMDLHTKGHRPKDICKSRETDTEWYNHRLLGYDNVSGTYIQTTASS